jgi:hypothetical protein
VAYNLGSFMLKLAMPKTSTGISDHVRHAAKDSGALVANQKERLIMIGAKVVSQDAT